jgi:rubredoxin
MKPNGAKRRRCPRCHSLRTTRMPHASAGSVASNHYRCDACGHIWTEPKSAKSSRLAA